MNAVCMFWAPSQWDRRDGWVGTGYEHRPKWLSFICTIHCSVLVSTILDLPVHSAGPTINWAPIQRQGNLKQVATTYARSPNLCIPTHMTVSPPTLPFSVQCQDLTPMAACFHEQYAQLHAWTQVGMPCCSLLPGYLTFVSTQVCYINSTWLSFDY